ncbi:hypothetical protein AB0942_10820 [Streptomyces nodosus]|uniref:hypothetical protein n=1 Tax=Streptomyces nodosus TaxID=40318 RepID=UPI003451AD8F
MAYFAPRKNEDGEITSYQARRRLGGGRTAPQQTERFPPTEEGQAAAEVFKEAVNEHEVNHWGQWALTSEAIHLGIEPKAGTLCYAFTQQWLRPILESEGVEDTPPPAQRAAAHTAAPGRRAPPPVTEPDPSAAQAPGLVGPCAHCRRPTHRYGREGRPLCQWCMAPRSEAVRQYHPLREHPAVASAACPRGREQARRIAS